MTTRNDAPWALGLQAVNERFAQREREFALQLEQRSGELQQLREQVQAAAADAQQRQQTLQDAELRLQALQAELGARLAAAEGAAGARIDALQAQVAADAAELQQRQHDVDNLRRDRDEAAASNAALRSEALAAGERLATATAALAQLQAEQTEFRRLAAVHEQGLRDQLTQAGQAAADERRRDSAALDQALARLAADQQAFRQEQAHTLAAMRSEQASRLDSAQQADAATAALLSELVRGIGRDLQLQQQRVDTQLQTRIDAAVDELQADVAALDAATRSGLRAGFDTLAQMLEHAQRAQQQSTRQDQARAEAAAANIGQALQQGADLLAAQGSRLAALDAGLRGTLAQSLQTESRAWREHSISVGDALASALAASDRRRADAETQLQQQTALLLARQLDHEREADARLVAVQQAANSTADQLAASRQEADSLRDALARAQGAAQALQATQQTLAKNLEASAGELAALRASLRWRLMHPFARTARPAATASPTLPALPPTANEPMSPQPTPPSSLPMNVMTQSTPTSAAQLLSLFDQEFVRQAYRAILGRSADESGLTFYLARVRRGVPKAGILVELAGSEEARQRGVVLEGLSELVEQAAQPRRAGRIARLCGLDAMQQVLSTDLHASENRLGARIDELRGMLSETDAALREVRNAVGRIDNQLSRGDGATATEPIGESTASHGRAQGPLEHYARRKRGLA